MPFPIHGTGRPEIPWSTDRYAYDQWIYNTLLQLQDALIPPAAVTNVRATGMAGAIQVDFTRSEGGSYKLFWNTTASLNGAVVIDLGNSNKYVDQIGAEGVKRYYAVQASNGNTVSAYSVWVSATTLALDAVITPPDPPPASQSPTLNTETNALDDASRAGQVGQKDLL